MLQFKRLTIDDIDILRRHMCNSGSRLCDCTVGGIMMWREWYKTRYAVSEDGTLIIAHDIAREGVPGGVTAYLAPSMPEGEMPVPGGAVCPKRVIDLVAEHCESAGAPIVFCAVSTATLEYLKKRFGDVTVQTNRNWYDYVYNASDLADYPGKRYAGQRNHRRRFDRQNEGWRIRELTAADAGATRDLLDRFYADNDPRHTGDEEGCEERTRVYEIIDRWDEYGMTGIGLDRGDGVLAALAIGELIGDTMYEHVEKADKSYEGAYQTIASSFADYARKQGALYVNREEDDGREGLRTSKLSYHPVALLEKYTVEVNDKTAQA